jgi:hypothetical protein
MWINTNTLGVFNLHSDIRYECWKEKVELPGVLTDEVLAQYGYAVVERTQPVYDDITQGIRALTPVLADGVWAQQWEVYALDPAIVLNNQNALAARERSGKMQQLMLLDSKTIRALREGNTERIAALEIEAIAIRATL